MRRLMFAVTYAALTLSCEGPQERVVIATVTNRTTESLDEVRVSFEEGSPGEEYNYDWSKPRNGQVPGEGEVQLLTIPIKATGPSQFSITGFNDGVQVSERAFYRSSDATLVERQDFPLLPKLSRKNGRVCASPLGCASGFCADGVCCNSSCDGLCRRCDSNGTCGSTAAGLSDPGTCEAPMKCTATGTCSATAASTSCTRSTDCRITQLCIAGTCQ